MLKHRTKNLYNKDETKISALAEMLAITKPTHSALNGASVSVGSTVSFHANCNGIVMQCGVGETYSVAKFASSGAIRQCFIEIDSTGLVLSKSGWGSGTYTTTNSDCAYLAIQWNAVSGGVDECQAVVVEGSTVPTEYIPYLNTPPELYISDGNGGYDYIGEAYMSDGNGGYQHIFSAGHDTEVTGNPLTMSDSRPKPISYEFTGNAKRTIEISSVEYIIPDTITLYTSVDDTDGNTYTPTGYVYPAKQGTTFGLYHFDTGVFQTEV